MFHWLLRTDLSTSRGVHMTHSANYIATPDGVHLYKDWGARNVIQH
ncbi:hypothetical protein SF06_14290 [Pseudomonas flexibilis]|uniref:Uncharacterized protein n=1 Tax=Pseudomonas flexibilis TaxID=706570 RepID=A0A1N6TMQ4_9PSED|nr:hypothetical protein SF06_14290 [Pseudomonas flexibilis]SIQ54625.1 hypothetical protein SAMN05421672_107140 [Pseudomonas flexibilis]